MEALADDLRWRKSNFGGPEGNVLWKRQPDELDEHRLLLTDTFVIEEESEEENSRTVLTVAGITFTFARGGSVHNSPQDHCQGAGLVHVSFPCGLLPMQEHKAARPAGFWCVPHAKPAVLISPHLDVNRSDQSRP